MSSALKFLEELAGVEIQSVQFFPYQVLLLSNDHNTVITLAQECSIESKYKELANLDIHKAKSSELAPFLALVGAVIKEVDIDRMENLTIYFENGSVVRASPHPNYESWILVHKKHCYPCSPYDRVSFYP